MILTNAENRESALLERWMQFLILRDTPDLLIFVLPGPGKTEFIRALRRKGISVADSDDLIDEQWPSPTVGTASQNDVYHQRDLAWRFPLATWTSSTRIMVTSFLPLIQQEVVKLGVTSICVNIPLGDYVSSFVGETASNADVELWNNLQTHLRHFNVVVGDFELIVEQITAHIAGFGARTFRLSTDRELGGRRAVGRMLRDNTYLWAQRRNKPIHLIGSEVETVSMIARLGGIARVSGLQGPGPQGYPHVFEFEGEASYRESDGQRKLYAVDFPFITSTAVNIIVVGGSPGDHFAQFDLSHKKLIIVDPRRPSVNPYKWISEQLKSVDELASYMSVPFVFLSDIRSDNFTEDDVSRDNYLQMSWFSSIMARYAKNCRGVSLKFRPPHDSVSFVKPSNMNVIFQPYNAGQSMETRLMWRPSDGTQFRMESHSTSLYAKSVASWNVARTSVPSLEAKQERRIATWLIEDLDYRGKLDRSELIIGFYTVSNNRSSHEVLDLLKKWNELGIEFVVNVPFSPIYGLLEKEGLGVVLTGGGGNDGLLLPSQFLGTGLTTHSIAEWISICSYEGQAEGDASACCSGSPFMREWFIVTNHKMKGDEMNFQTWISSQTWSVKYITAALRDVWGHTNSTLHQVRRDVVEAFGGVGIDDPRVNGVITVDGREIHVSVSGHLVNLVIANNVHVIDFDRWLNTVRSNLWSVYTKRGASVWKRLNKKGVLAEDGQKYPYPRLYHGYYDFKLAELVIMSMAKKFDFIIDLRVVAYVMGELDKMLVSYPEWKYAISADAANFVSVER